MGIGQRIQYADPVAILGTRRLTLIVLASATGRLDSHGTGLYRHIFDGDEHGGRCASTWFGLRGTPDITARILTRRGRDAARAHVEAYIVADDDLIAAGREDGALLYDDHPFLFRVIKRGAAHHSPAVKVSVVSAELFEKVVLVECQVVGRNDLPRKETWTLQRYRRVRMCKQTAS